MTITERHDDDDKIIIIIIIIIIIVIRILIHIIKTTYLISQNFQF